MCAVGGSILDHCTDVMANMRVPMLRTQGRSTCNRLWSAAARNIRYRYRDLFLFSHTTSAGLSSPVPLACLIASSWHAGRARECATLYCSPFNISFDPLNVVPRCRCRDVRVGPPSRDVLLEDAVHGVVTHRRPRNMLLF